MVSKVMQSSRGFHAVCTNCNISIFGLTATEAEDKFAGWSLKYKFKEKQK